MKKIIASGFGVALILCILYFASDSNNYASAGNNDDEFEYEYYYNTDKTGDNDMTDTASTSANDNKKIEYSSNIPDTEPESISVFINKEYALPESYIPDNLVVADVTFFGGASDDKNKMRKEAADALEKMFSDAKDDNIFLYGVSAYRSYQRQKEIYEKNVRSRGANATDQVSAAPGHSEHQSGLAIDITTKTLGCNLCEYFGETAEGKWVAKNCYQYGFIIRYPKDAEQITGYSYEPWHIRYVGTEIAEYIHKENITLEEYYGYTLSDYYLENIISDASTSDNNK